MVSGAFSESEKITILLYDSIVWISIGIQSTIHIHLSRSRRYIYENRKMDLWSTSTSGAMTLWVSHGAIYEWIRLSMVKIYTDFLDEGMESTGEVPNAMALGVQMLFWRLRLLDTS